MVAFVWNSGILRPKQHMRVGHENEFWAFSNTNITDAKDLSRFYVVCLVICLLHELLPLINLVSS